MKDEAEEEDMEVGKVAKEEEISTKESHRESLHQHTDKEKVHSGHGVHSKPSKSSHVRDKSGSVRSSSSHSHKSSTEHGSKSERSSSSEKTSRHASPHKSSRSSHSSKSSHKTSSSSSHGTPSKSSSKSGHSSSSKPSSSHHSSRSSSHEHFKTHRDKEPHSKPSSSHRASSGHSNSSKSTSSHSMHSKSSSSSHHQSSQDKLKHSSTHAEGKKLSSLSEQGVLSKESNSQPTTSAGSTDETDRIKAVNPMAESKDIVDLTAETPENTAGDQAVVTESGPEPVAQGHHSPCGRTLCSGSAEEEAAAIATEDEKDNTLLSEAVLQVIDEQDVVSPKQAEETEPETKSDPASQASTVPSANESLSDSQGCCQGNLTHAVDTPVGSDVNPEPERQPAAMEMDSPVRKDTPLEQGEQNLVLAFDPDQQKLVLSLGDCSNPVTVDRKDNNCSEPIPADAPAEKMEISDDGTAEHLHPSSP